MQMNDKRLGIAVIGAGAMGGMHLDGWKEASNVELKVVADPDVARAEKLGSEHGIEHISDWRAAIDRDDIDAVSVCVPTCFHPDVCVFAAEHGKHVICEKPIAVDLAGADRMIEAAEQNGTHLTIGLLYRTHPATASLGTDLRNGRLGRPLYFSLNSTAGVRPKPLMHDANGNGGPFIDYLVHFADWWSVLVDSQIEWVSALGCTYATNASHGLADIKHLALDTGGAIMRFASGDMASVMVSWALPHGAVWLTTAHINGPNGRLVGAPTGPMEYYEGDAQEPTDVIPAPDCSLVAQELRVFADAVRTGKPPFAPARQARQQLMVSLAILESMKTGQPVTVA